MTARIDSSGRIELPEALTKQFGIGPGDTIEIGEREGEWIIRPAADGALLNWEGPVLVYAGRLEGDASVALRDVREGRIQGLSFDGHS